MDSPVLLAEWLHPLSEFIESQQALLISSQQPFHTFLQPRLLTDQMLLTLLRRISLFGCFQPPSDLSLQYRGVFQQGSSSPLPD